MKKENSVTGVAAKKAPKDIPTKKQLSVTNKAPSVLPTKSTFWHNFAVVALMLVWVFCSVVVSQLLVGYLMLWILGAEALDAPMVSGIYSVLSYALALVLIIFVPPQFSAKWKISFKTKKRNHLHTGEKIIQKSTREGLGLKGVPTWTDIGLSAVGFIVSTLAAAALAALFSLFPWFDAGQAQETGFTAYMSGGERVVAFIVLVVLAPIVEEIIFRGWLYGKLRTRLNMPVAILLTSLLFGIMHFQWNVGVNVFALSVVLCGLREITGTIYAGILTHMIKNGVAFYLLYVLGM